MASGDIIGENQTLPESLISIARRGEKNVASSVARDIIVLCLNRGETAWHGAKNHHQAYQKRASIIAPLLAARRIFRIIARRIILPASRAAISCDSISVT